MSNRAASNFRKIQEWKKAASLLAFMSFGEEINTRALIAAAIEERKTVYIPKVKDRQMYFLKIDSPEGPFEKGVFGIREPVEGSQKWDPAGSPGPVIIAVPGVAFDKTGKRLGRGGGYYDRFIEKIRSEARNAGEKPPFFAGFAYNMQIVENIPAEDHDQKIDALITEKDILIFSR